jgi:hypothetical protein
MHQNTYLTRYRHLVEAEFGIKEREDWDNNTFEKLSSMILEKTGERLSVSTLKRIWGKVSYQHAPAKSTLNILARYAGYENWRSFVMQTNVEQTESAIPVQSKNQNIPNFFVKRWLKVAVPVLIIAVICVSLSRIDKPIQNLKAAAVKTSFAAHKTSDNLPNSVIFSYSVSGLPSARVIIQQSWDSTRREQVNAGNHKHASMYYYPGYFVTKLMVNGKIQKETPVFIQTKGWKGIIKRSPLPVYLSTAETHKNKGLGIDAATILKKTGLSVFNDIWTEFANVRPYQNVKGDNFRLETRLANTSTGEESLCRNVKITVLGKGGAIIIPLAMKGCEANLSVLTGDQLINGREDDLSALGCKFPEYQQVAVEVSGSKLQVTINQQLVLERAVTYTIGEIVGLRYAFEGTGEIRQISLYSGKKTVYTENFN